MRTRTAWTGPSVRTYPIGELPESSALLRIPGMTDKQHRFLRSLGVPESEMPTGRKEASYLISRRLRERAR